MQTVPLSLKKKTLYSISYDIHNESIRDLVTESIFNLVGLDPNDKLSTKSPIWNSLYSTKLIVYSGDINSICRRLHKYKNDAEFNIIEIKNISKFKQIGSTETQEWLDYHF